MNTARCNCGRIVGQQEWLESFNRTISEFELDPYAQAIYQRIAYRSGGGQTCYESVANMARTLGMSRRKAQQVVSDLTERDLIRKNVTPDGQPNEYVLTDAPERRGRAPLAHLPEHEVLTSPGMRCAPSRHEVRLPEHEVRTNINLRSKTPLPPKGEMTGEDASLGDPPKQAVEILTLPLEVDAAEKPKPAREKRKRVPTFARFKKRIESGEVDVKTIEPDRFEELWQWARQKFQENGWDVGPKTSARVKFAFLLDRGFEIEDIVEGVKLAIEQQASSAGWSYPIENFLYDGRGKQPPYRWRDALDEKELSGQRLPSYAEFCKKHFGWHRIRLVHTPQLLELLGHPTSLEAALETLVSMCPDALECGGMILRYAFQNKEAA